MKQLLIRSGLALALLAAPAVALAPNVTFNLLQAVTLQVSGALSAASASITGAASVGSLTSAGPVSVGALSTATAAGTAASATPGNAIIPTLTRSNAPTVFGFYEGSQFAPSSASNSAPIFAQKWTNYSNGTDRFANQIGAVLGEVNFVGSGTSAPNTGTWNAIHGTCRQRGTNQGTPTAQVWDAAGSCIGVTGTASAEGYPGNGTAIAGLWGYPSTPNLDATTFANLPSGEAFATYGTEVNINYRHPDPGFRSTLSGQGSTVGHLLYNYRSQDGDTAQYDWTFGMYLGGGSRVPGSTDAANVDSYRGFHTGIFLNLIKERGILFGTLMKAGSYGVAFPDAFSGTQEPAAGIYMGGAKINLGQYTGSTFNENDLWRNGDNIYWRHTKSGAAASESLLTNRGGVTTLSANHTFSLNGGFGLNLQTATNAVNYMSLINAATGGSPVFSAVGADTSIPISFTPKGPAPVIMGGNALQFTGQMPLTINGGYVARLNTVASAVNYFDFYNGATGGYPALVAAGSDTNVGLELRPKNAGTVFISGGGTKKIEAGSAGIGFNGTAPVAKATITGSRDASPATANLLSALAGNGLVADATTFGTTTQRAPTVADDTSRSYTVGSFWRAPDGRFYQAQDVTAGTAAWTPVAVSKRTLALDAVPGAVAAYATTRLSSTYAGPAIQVTRASDSTTKDIGFLTDGMLDASTLDAFLAGTTGRVTTWYDQSGNARHATQSVGSAPTITALRMIGGHRTIVFDARPDAANTSNPSPSFTSLVLPSSVSIVPQASTVAVVGGMQSVGRIAGFLNVGGSGTSVNLSSNVYGNGTNLGNGGSGVLQASAQPTDGGALIMGVSSAAASTLSIDDAVATSATQIGASSTVTGGWIGGGWQSNARSGFVDTGAVVIYGSALSVGQQAGLKASLYAAFDMNPQNRSTVVVMGDSHTDSFGSSLQQDWPRKMAALLGRPDVRYVNTGIYGEQVSLMVTRFGYDVQPALTAAAGASNCYVIINGGWNDIVSGGASAATVYSNIQSLAASVRSAGCKAVVSTSVLRSASAANLTTMQSLNSSIRSGWSGFADGFIDFAAYAPFAQASGWGAPYFQPDATHLTDQGYSLMGAIATEKMRAYLQ